MGVFVSVQGTVDAASIEEAQDRAWRDAFEQSRALSINDKLGAKIFIQPTTGIFETADRLQKRGEIMWRYIVVVEYL